jgi:hypothetical protein
MIMQCSLALTDSLSSNSHKETEEFHIKDQILGALILIVDKVYLKLSTELPGRKKKEDKIFFLKLFNKFFSINLGQDSFHSFINILNGTTNSTLTNDPDLISLVLKKALKMRLEITEILISSLQNKF